ncbi:lethal(3)malignant brain tumor-like protein 4 [Eucyclogobius newberryi]|uniref:lethal(3)malignant brain tumor-like protein 4 n=1 Tax=Eucyclogobius newberryi TaxID=166745 RepID=UPI003B593363
MKNKVTSSATAGLSNRSWSWSQYLEHQNTPAAPLEVFNQYQSGPSRRSCGFRVGMKLEGVDPLHPSMFCVLTVAEVIGFRLRLHIDGFSESYDFWVNSDSPEIKPIGFCQETKRILHPPKGVPQEQFDWSLYLQQTSSEAAPESVFRRSSSAPCRMRPGLKLEAVDRKNPALVCVASVADVDQERIRVTFDLWDESYDYWCHGSSPFVHPVGWCQEQARPLTAPKGHPDPEHFVWEQYLKETSSEAATSHAFTQSGPHGFHVNHRLEAVDRRNPVLIRVASVIQSEDVRIKVHYDGWPAHMDWWFDCDDPDLHPVGWCHWTGHPLEPPRDFFGPSSPAHGSCPTLGCRGVGHIRGPKYSNHHSLFGCPYSETNLRKDLLLPNRLGPEPGLSLLPNRPVEEVPLKRRRLSPRVCAVTPAVLKQEEDLNTDPVLVQSRFLSALSPQPSRDLSLCWSQHRKLLPRVQSEQAKRVHCWSVQQVSEFIQSLLGCEDQAQHFRDQEIDGRAFLLLTQRDIVQILSIKLGPALKIYHSILMFKHERSQSEHREGARSQSEHREGARSQSEHREGAGDQSEHREGAGDQSEHREGAGDQSEHREGAGDQSEGREGAGGQSERREGEGGQSECREGAGGQSEHREGARSQSEHREGAGDQSEHREGAGDQSEHREGAGDQSEGREGAGGQSERREGEGGQSECREGAGGQSECREGAGGQSECREGAGGQSERRKGAED